MSNGLTRIEMDALNAVRDMNRKMKDQRKVDWEQRRYEVARDIFTRCLSSEDDEMRAFCYRKIELHAEECVKAADALIAELKKGEEE